MRRALVVSGGGSKGAFAVGVIRQLKRNFPALEFDFFVGTSTGALLLPLAAMDQYTLLEELYTAQETEDVLLKSNIGNRLNEHSIFDATPLWLLIGRYYNDTRYNELVNSGKKIYLNTVCLQTGELVVFTNDEDAIDGTYYKVKRIFDADHFRRAIMASACQPVFMPPIRVNLNVPGEPHPNYQFVDGGVREYVGIQMAIDAGAKEIIVIILSPENDPPEEIEYKNLFHLLERSIDVLSGDIGKNDLLLPAQFNEALTYIAAVKTKMLADGISADVIHDYFSTPGIDNPFVGKMPLKIYTIRPETPLGGGPGGLTFDPNEMKEMLAKGRQVLNQYVATLDPDDTSGWV
ncbi:MAG: patatin-like phospholipase family protein [Bacteroidota bacterium]